MEIIIKPVTIEACTPDLLAQFQRHQEVKRCWRWEKDCWVLRDIAYIEDWDGTQKARVTDQLRRCLEDGGAVAGAFDGDRLVGFAAVEKELFGSCAQYADLYKIHTSLDCRNRGVGKRLFAAACDLARGFGAEKLYISAHSAEDSMAFYRKIGCVDAVEINAKLAEEEPCDCQLEFVL